MAPLLVGRGGRLDVIRDRPAGGGAGLLVAEIALRLLLEGDLEELVLVEVVAVARHSGGGCGGNRRRGEEIFARFGLIGSGGDPSSESSSTGKKEEAERKGDRKMVE